MTSHYYKNGIVRPLTHCFSAHEKNQLLSRAETPRIQRKIRELFWLRTGAPVDWGGPCDIRVDQGQRSYIKISIRWENTVRVYTTLYFRRKSCVRRLYIKLRVWDSCFSVIHQYVIFAQRWILPTYLDKEQRFSWDLSPEV